MKNKLHFLDKHPFLIPVITIIGLFLLTPIFFIIAGAETLGPADSRVVHVYVDGEERTLPTRAKTVNDLLERLDVKVGKHDVVEPAVDKEILQDDFAVNIYRSRTVTVVDKGKSITKRSAGQSPEAIAKDLGVKLLPEDRITPVVPEDVIEEGISAEKFEIERSTGVKLVLYGKPYDIRTHAKTVAGLLKEKEINPDEVTVFPKTTTKLKEGAVVYVTLPGKTIVSREVSIPNKTKEVKDPDLPAGVTEVREEGRNGKKVVLFEIDKKTKKKKALKSVIAIEPVDRVIAVGTKIDAPGGTVSGGKLQWMRAAGIDSSQYQYVDHIIGRESGWNPGSVSANRCIGLGQRCNPQILINDCPNWQNDPVCQLQHFSSYANGRYGSWQGAYSFWQVNHWW